MRATASICRAVFRGFAQKYGILLHFAWFLMYFIYAGISVIKSWYDLVLMILQLYSCFMESIQGGMIYEISQNFIHSYFYGSGNQYHRAFRQWDLNLHNPDHRRVGPNLSDRSGRMVSHRWAHSGKADPVLSRQVLAGMSQRQWLWSIPAKKLDDEAHFSNFSAQRPIRYL